jgi:hypothetical protein
VKVRIIQKRGYGDRYQVFHEFGEVVDYPDDLAQKLITYRIAIPLNEKPQRKTAVTTGAFFEPPENTATRTTKPKAR